MAQRHKGDRLQLVSRAPVAVGEAVRHNAEERGMNVSDYIASVLAREVGLDALAPQTAVRPRYEELPISAA
jgi:hypothetical protein